MDLAYTGCSFLSLTVASAASLIKVGWRRMILFQPDWSAIMMQPKRNDPPPNHQCPVCRHPQTKIQRRLNADKNGSTIYVCGRAGDCSVGMDLTKVETWVAV